MDTLISVKLEHELTKGWIERESVKGGKATTMPPPREQQITSNIYKLDYLIILFTVIYAGKQATTAAPFVRHMLYVIM